MQKQENIQDDLQKISILLKKIPSKTKLIGVQSTNLFPKYFAHLYNKVLDYLKEKDELFVFKGFAGADKNHRLPIQVINEFAWHNLFAHQLFIRPSEEELIRT